MPVPITEVNQRGLIRRVGSAANDIDPDGRPQTTRAPVLLGA
jgi:hypothetical protein